MTTIIKNLFSNDEFTIRKLMNLICDQMHINIKDISETTKLRHLDIDPLDICEIINSIKKIIDIELNDIDVELTIEELYNFLAKKGELD